jgi:hypothetical protein
LRQLAESLLRNALQEEVPDAVIDELATSLVRQWITYDGNATLFLAGQQIYLILSKTPQGEPCIVPEPALPSWKRQLIRDWKIGPEELAAAFEQLNRGQSAEVINAEGVAVRLWVNPNERSKGVESQVQQPVAADWKRNYHKIATDTVEQHIGTDMDPEELEALICSVAQQWQKYEGHACLFDWKGQFLFTLTEQPGGNCCVETRRVQTEIEATLNSLGFPAEVMDEVIARLNFGHEIEFRDRQGVRSRLWHDPKARRLIVQAIDPRPSMAENESPPLLCPRCSAVLGLWERSQRQQRCPRCGATVLRS